jgi:hypothetical protein
MTTLKRIFRSAFLGSNRVGRYYSDVLHTGTGIPTAEETRKDLNGYDRSVMPIGWLG